MPLPKDRYAYRVVWSEEDGEYVGLCEEFPSLSWLSESPESAFGGIRELVAQVVGEMRKSGERIPEPATPCSHEKEVPVVILSGPSGNRPGPHIGK